MIEKRANGLLGVICKVSNRETLSGERFCFFEKSLLSALSSYYFLKKFCASSMLLFFFYELLIGPQPNFLGPGYSSRTVNAFLIKRKTIYDRL